MVEFSPVLSTVNSPESNFFKRGRVDAVWKVKRALDPHDGPNHPTQSIGLGPQAQLVEKLLWHSNYFLSLIRELFLVLLFD